MSAGHIRRVAAGLVLAAILFHGGWLSAQVAAQRPDTLELTIDAAVRRAVDGSDEVRLARAQADWAGAQVRLARSDVFPQINAFGTYTRTFDSPFATEDSGPTPDSLIFRPDPTLPLADRVAYLENNVGLAAMSGLGSLFGDLPFGRDHAWSFGVTASQTLFSPRLGSAIRIANQVNRIAGLAITEEEAEMTLQVRTAYYRALLAREMAAISREALAQARSFLAEERQREDAGVASELEVLRAEVEMANLEPQLVASENAAELAELDLKRLLNLPLDQPVRLTSTLAAPAAAPDDPSAGDVASMLARRASVESAERQVQVRKHQVTMARNAFLPSLSLRMNYGKLVYPERMLGFSGQRWSTDWNAALSIDLPIFTGFRRFADTDAARAELSQAELQLGQLTEAVQLQYEQARTERARAWSAIEARRQTVDQADRVHSLTVLRYERGLATQLEVSGARLSLLQARTNLAQALSDYYTADAGVQRALGLNRTTSAGPGVPTSR